MYILITVCLIILYPFIRFFIKRIILRNNIKRICRMKNFKYKVKTKPEYNFKYKIPETYHDKELVPIILMNPTSVNVTYNKSEIGNADSVGEGFFYTGNGFCEKLISDS